MIQIFNRIGEPIRTSKNLRGIIEHARKVKPIKVVLLKDNDGGGELRIRFADYSHTVANFASFSVLQSWVKARRSWTGYEFTIVA